MKGDFGGVPYETEWPIRGDTSCAHARVRVHTHKVSLQNYHSWWWSTIFSGLI